MSAVGNGMHSVGVMGTDPFPVMVATRLGAVRNYGVLEAGWSPYLEDGHQIVTLRGGPGVRFPLNVGGLPLLLDVEAVCGVLHRADNLVSDGLQLTTSTRALAAAADVRCVRRPRRERVRARPPPGLQRVCGTAVSR